MKSTVVLCILLLLRSVNSICLASTEEFELATFDDYLQEKSLRDEVKFSSEELTIIEKLFPEFFGRISLVKLRNIRLLSVKVNWFVSWKMKVVGEICLELITVSIKGADVTPVAWCGEIAIGLKDVILKDITLITWNTKLFGCNLSYMRYVLNLFMLYYEWKDVMNTCEGSE